MSVDYQVIDVKFTQGLDTKAQAKLVVPGKWALLSNLTLTKDYTPRRRDGISPLVATITGFSTSSGNGLAIHNDELLTIEGPHLNSVSVASGTPVGIRQTGSVGNVFIDKTDIKKAHGVVDSVDCATGGGYTCYVWRDITPPNAAGGAATVNGIKYSLFDEATGTTIVSEVLVDTAATCITPRVVFSVDAFFIFFIITATTTLNCRVIRTSAPASIGAKVALVTSANLESRNIDACEFGSALPSASSVLVVYAWGDGTTAVRDIRVIHAAGVPSVGSGPNNLQTFAAVAGTKKGLSVTPFTSTSCGVFCLSDGGVGLMDGLSGVVVDSSGVLTAGPALLGTVHSAAGIATHLASVLSGTSMAIFWDVACDQNNVNAWNQTYRVVVDVALTILFAEAGIIPAATSTGSAGNACGPEGPFICGKPYLSGTSLYLPCCVLEDYKLTTAHTNNEQNTFFLFDVTSALTATPVGVVVAKALYQTLGCPHTTPILVKPLVTTPCSIAATASGEFSIATTQVQRLEIQANINVSSIGVARIKMTPNTTVSPTRAQLELGTFISGGNITEFDGFGVAEHGFPLFPEGIGSTVVNPGGTITPGTHQIVAIYEWIDAAGRRHQSAPSLPFSVTTVANDKITLKIPTLLVSQKTGVDIVVFMTQANGLTFNRLFSIPGALPNITTTNIATYDVISADAVFAGNELLYTQPNQTGTTLPNMAPPPNAALALHQNRIFIDVADRKNAYRYSQQVVPTVGLQWNDALGGTVDSNGGDIVGFSPLDEKVLIFCERKIFVIYGTGPNAAGGFNNYSEPQEVPSDVGCSDTHSILRMPEGVIFKSTKGWYMVGRGLNVEYIGAGVEAYNANSVSAAVLLEDRQECRFSSASGVTLVYSYDTKQWATFEPTGSPYAVADAIWWPTLGCYVTISNTELVNYDVVGQSYDAIGARAPVGITIQGRTAWLHLQGLDGFQRVRRAYLTATKNGTPTSTMTVQVDYDDNYGLVSPGSYAFTVNMGTVSTAGTNLDFRFKLQRQKCKTVAFTFIEYGALYTDVLLTGIQALSLEIGLKRGLKKLPAAQSVG